LIELPKGVTLDGELFHSRNNFSETVSIVRSAASQKWGEITFKVRALFPFLVVFKNVLMYERQVFDMPSLKKDTFEKRMLEMNEQFGGKVTGKGEDRSSVIDVVKHFKCKSHDHLVSASPELFKRLLTQDL
jgi:hypothetical protein